MILKKVNLVKNYPSEDRLPEDGMYRYLLQPGEEHNDQHKRATDRIWSQITYRLSKTVEDPGHRVMYYLSDGREGAFMKEGLMLILEDTDYVQKW